MFFINYSVVIAQIDLDHLSFLICEMVKKQHQFFKRAWLFLVTVTAKNSHYHKALLDDSGAFYTPGASMGQGGELDSSEGNSMIQAT